MSNNKRNEIIDNKLVECFDLLNDKVESSEVLIRDKFSKFIDDFRSFREVTEKEYAEEIVD